MRSALLRRVLGLCCAWLVLFSGCEERSTGKDMRIDNAAADWGAKDVYAPAFSAPVTIDQALQTALEYNLDLWMARQEEAVRRELATGERLRMLPSLLLDTELSERSELPASTSVNLRNGTVALDPSYSAEKQKRRLEAGAMWNLLDFGVAYMRGCQAEDHAAIAAERLARTRQTLALKVTRAWWRAAAAKEAARQADEVAAAISKLQAAVATAVESRAISEIEALERETPLLEQQIVLDRYRQEYRNALAELSTLLGCAPGAELDVQTPDFDALPAHVEYDARELEKETLLSRPELYEQDRQVRIAEEEAKIALARMFPSPALFLRYENDRNKYLYYNHWYTAGLRATWDLLSIPAKLRDRKAAKLRAGLAGRKRVALTAGILTQLHLSLIEYEETTRQLEMARVISEKRGRLAEALREEMEKGKGNAGAALDQQLKHLAARARFLMARANAATAVARIETTVGRETVVLPETKSDVSAAPQKSTLPVVGVLAVRKDSMPAAGALAGACAEGEVEDAEALVEIPVADAAQDERGSETPFAADDERLTVLIDEVPGVHLPESPYPLPDGRTARYQAPYSETRSFPFVIAPWPAPEAPEPLAWSTLRDACMAAARQALPSVVSVWSGLVPSPPPLLAAAR